MQQKDPYKNSNKKQTSIAQSQVINSNRRNDLKSSQSSTVNSPFCVCENCQYSNFYYKLQCEHCQKPIKKEEQKMMDSSFKQSEIMMNNSLNNRDGKYTNIGSSYIPSMTGGSDWICAFCKERNKFYKDRCEFCRRNNSEQMLHNSALKSNNTSINKHTLDSYGSNGKGTNFPVNNSFLTSTNIKHQPIYQNNVQSNSMSNLQQRDKPMQNYTQSISNYGNIQRNSIINNSNTRPILPKSQYPASINSKIEPTKTTQTQLSQNQIRGQSQSRGNQSQIVRASSNNKR
jgi:hypothetical protein